MRVTRSPLTWHPKQLKSPSSRFSEADATLSSWKGQRTFWLPSLSGLYSTPSWSRYGARS